MQIVLQICAKMYKQLLNVHWLISQVKILPKV